MDNRTYLALRLKGGLSENTFYDISCTVNEAGEISFSCGKELLSADSSGGGYNIEITGPGGVFEIWLGNGYGDDRTVISFAEPMAAPVTPVDILESFRRWKAGEGVQESTRQGSGGFIREYRPSAQQPAPVSTIKQ